MQGRAVYVRVRQEVGGKLRRGDWTGLNTATAYECGRDRGNRELSGKRSLPSFTREWPGRGAAPDASKTCSPGEGPLAASCGLLAEGQSP